MGEDSFFDALAHIMWEMDVDIFTEQDKTLALVADFVPKCKKQQRRLRAMYECGAMDKIERAVAEKESYAELMWEAVDLISQSLETSESKAVFCVNQIIALWDGDLPILDDSDETEESSAEAAQNNTEQEGEDEMLFLQDVAEEQTENQPEAENQSEEQSQAEQPPAEPAEPILTKLVQFWCKNDCEQGRPYMATCPIGWIFILFCTALGAIMVYDVPRGDKFIAPVFVFMFVILIGKRHYRYESVGRLSIVIGLFYLAAGARLLWIGSDTPLRCLPIVAAALIVFNNGRFAGLLDGEKKRPAFGYLLIFLMSGIITAGVYAIQNVHL